MDMSKVVTEPYRRRMEVMIIGAWMAATYYVKSKMLKDRIETLVKHYGHLVGLASMEQTMWENAGPGSYKRPAVMVTYTSGRSEAHTYIESEFPRGNVQEVRNLVNHIHTELWNMMSHLQKQTNREMMH